MYIGGCIVLFGYGLYEHSPAILIFAAPWLLLAHLFVILYEEPHLRATFGAPYGAYCLLSPSLVAPAVDMSAGTESWSGAGWNRRSPARGGTRAF